MSALHMFHEQTDISYLISPVSKKRLFQKPFEDEFAAKSISWKLLKFSQKDQIKPHPSPNSIFNLLLRTNPCSFGKQGEIEKPSIRRNQRQKYLRSNLNKSWQKYSLQLSMWLMKVAKRGGGKALRGQSLITCDLTKEEKSGKGAFQMRCNYSYVTEFYIGELFDCCGRI